MKSTTRKHIWPVSLVMALAVVGVLAALVALSGGLSVSPPGAAQAQGDGGPTSPFTRNTPTPEPTATAVPPTMPPTSTPPPTATPAPATGVENDISTDSTTSGSGIKVTVKIGNLPMPMRAGSSVVLYLEDDFQVPDSIPRDTVYFTVTNREKVATGQGGRVYVTDPIELEEDDYYGGDDDTSIRVYLPDFNTGDDWDGFQGPDAGQTLTMVITEAGGIKNPTEAHDSDNDYVDGYKASYDVLPVGGDVKGAPPADGVLRGDRTTDNPKTNFDHLIVKAKISLSDEDNTRGYSLIVSGSGFNNGTSAAVHVLADDNTNPDLAALLKSNQDQLCQLIIRDGDRAGIATVDGSDRVEVEFDVTVPVFKPGDVNYLCMVDGEGRRSFDDVEMFKLEPSIRVSPANATVGDTVNVFAQDYPTPNDALTSLKIANQEVYASSARPENRISVNSDPIGNDGSATATFEMPGSVSGSPLEGTVRIDAKWGTVSEDAKITLTGSTLRLSVGEARANESVTIQGEGFGSGRGHVCAHHITIDGVPLEVDDDSLVSRSGCASDNVGTGDAVEVSNAGQFVATVYLWNKTGNSNPALISGVHNIRAQDSQGFYGVAPISIKEPSIEITPDTLGPRDFLTVTGADWPVDNQDSDARIGNVVVEVESGANEREYTIVPDATGRFIVRHQVSRRVGIPSTQQVKVTYGSGDIVKVSNFNVPAASIEVSPSQGQPGDEVNLTVEGMPVYTEVEEITIGGANALGSRTFRTDRDGVVTADKLAIPGLDPGTYSVIMKVGSGSNQTVAIGSIEVLLEEVPGAKAELPAALDDLGENLVRVFYFDNVSKGWSFFDPREEFAELNTLNGLITGQAYWILVGEAVDEVVLNDKTRTLSCINGDCWTLIVW